MQNIDTKKLRNLAIVAVFLLAVGLTLRWFLNNSYISISVVGTSSDNEKTYTITKIGGDKPISIKTTENTVKKMVPKGDYSVEVYDQEKSYFKSIQTKGLLATTDVEAKLYTEKQRIFNGDQPDSCRHINNQILLSWPCGGSYDKIKKHIPATASQPTYAQVRQTPNIPAFIQGVITTQEGTLVLLKSQETVLSPVLQKKATPRFFIQIIDDNLKQLREKEITGLDPNSSYAINNFYGGFVIYSADNGQALQFKNLDDQDPKTIDLPKPEDTKLVNQYMSSSPLGLATLYSNAMPGEKEGDETQENTTTFTSFYDGEKGVGATKENSTYSSANYCWKNKLCMVSGDFLEVYDASNIAGNPEYRIPNISDVFPLGNKLFLVNEDRIYDFNPETREGYSIYSLGEYTFCGIYASGTNPMVCVSNSGNESMLPLDMSIDNVDSIDKKIIELEDVKDVKGVSVYHEYIYVTYDAGEEMYNKSTRSFGYDPDTKNAVSAAVNKKIDGLGIDRSKYFIKLLPG